MTELAYVNGVFCPMAEAKVSIEDRGFQFGDGVYEVIVAYDGHPFLPEEHLVRLKRSADALGLDFEPESYGLMQIVIDGLHRSQIGDALIYIQITRGTAPRSHVIPAGLEPTVVVTFRERAPVPPPLRENGVSVMTLPETRWARCCVKAITLLPNVLAKNEALRRGHYDAVFVTADGEVRECTSANLFLVHGTRISIPRRTESILHGVTQGFILECASNLGMEVEERRVAADELYDAGELFMSGTTVEVLAITTVDDKRVGDGRVGPVCRQLHEEFVATRRAISTGRAARLKASQCV